MPTGKEARSEFVTALLAHDISNYNQTSRGYLEMLLDEQMGALTEDQSRAITICLRQSNRIQSLIESVRLIADLSDVPSEPRALSLDDAILDAIQHTQSTYADREVRVHFTPGDRAVLAEAAHLPTVFQHLLSNAVRHNDTEVVEIHVQVTRDPPDDKTTPWKILIRDNGEGIPEPRQPHLFNRLESLAIHGSGLGLSLVRFLVERWNGQVWIEPRADGQGAVFGLTLPSA
jgi:signal transduction histidine kinase